MGTVSMEKKKRGMKDAAEVKSIVMIESSPSKPFICKD